MQTMLSVKERLAGNKLNPRLQNETSVSCGRSRMHVLVLESRRCWHQGGGMKRRRKQEEKRTGGGSLVPRWITYSLISTDGMDLGAEHHRCEDEEEETLKAQEYEEDDCCWRREGTALWDREGHGGKEVQGQTRGSCATTPH